MMSPARTCCTASVAPRSARAPTPSRTPPAASACVTEGGIRKPLDLAKLQTTIESAGQGLGEFVDSAAILKETLKNLYDGIPVESLQIGDSVGARAGRRIRPTAR